MSDASNRAPSGLKQRPPGYAEWLTDLKARIQTAQQRAALAVNRELLQLYWGLERDILARQAQESWGAGIIDQVSLDLRAAFPDMKGFSRSNFKYMRAFAEAWHNLVLLTKLRTAEARLAYAQRATTMAGPATCSRCTSSSARWSERARR